MAGAQWSEPTVTDDDRLPWLETADDEQPTSLGRVIGLVLVGLVALAAIFGGVYWFKHRPQPAGNGDLIAPPVGPYKVKPDDAGGLKVQGEGDAAVAASGGAGGNGAIAAKNLPETPIVGKKAPSGTSASGGSSTATASVAGSGGKLTAPPPGRPVPISSGGGGGALVQLGSFPSEGSANSAWSQLSKRFSYLANLGKSIEKAEVNGRTFYRLKVNAGSASAAQDLCGKIKVAGEACIVTS
ncbi:MAG: SPOR domain-containing protein [Sphingomonas sp.]|uniref:SPOR domain-containing protein n=1 Tax=Sphingomonas sp. TaxID=28214 RepID=UPI001AC21B76|nr:SPOR domain-containing protein [Sphingomonas sp.]MBN8808357.1 SPOR domain-containing protein [Sphingomonas sp.]